jgi:transcriptional regulator with GAF, ATPase, and Fis domain
MILVQALSLAADGRVDDALEWIRGPEVERDERTRLVEVIVLGLAADPARRAEADDALRAFEGGEATLDAVARLERARLLRRGGKRDAAARVLRALVADLRQGAEIARETWPRLVALDVRAMEQQSDRASGSPHSAALAIVVDLASRLAGVESGDEALRHVLDVALETSGAQRGAVLAADDDVLRIVAARTAKGRDLQEGELAASRSAVASAMDHHRPVRLVRHDLSGGHPAEASLASEGVEHLIAAPIADAEGAIGALYLDSRDPTRELSLDDAVLAVLTRQAAAWTRAVRRQEKTALALSRAEETLRRERAAAPRSGLGALVGSSDAMQSVYRAIERFAALDLPVLVRGETGVGKEVVARELHERSARRAARFFSLNCAALPETLLEAELFGHEKGAFTGAESARPGVFELADGGTLFLDEIGDTAARLQAVLLRVLESGEVRRLGARQSMRVDVRVVAATHRDLEELVEEGTFRMDLFYRLNVLRIDVPPLRERIEDLRALAEAVWPKPKPQPRLAPEAWAALARHRWPGNIRELRNVLARLAFLGESEAEIDVGALPDELRETSSSGADTLPAVSLREAERMAVERAMRASGGNKSEAARILGIDRKTLYAKVRLHGMGD